MSAFLQQVVIGLREGSLFALVALGLVMIYKTSGVLNFSYGHMGMLTAYIAFSLLTFGNMPIGIVLILSLIVGFCIGAVTERGLIRQVRGASSSAMLIITLGILLMLEGTVLQIWKQDYRPFPNLATGVPYRIVFPQARIIVTRQDLLIMLVTGVIMLALFLYLRFTRMGLASRATASNERAARLIGVRTGVVYATSWGLGITLSALAAILAAPRTQLHPNMMVSLQIQGLTAAVLGGFESLPGTIVGGFLLGVIQQLVSYYISPELNLAFSLSIILVILLVRPSGLLSSKSSARV